MFKVIIAGGREFDDYPTLKKFCQHVLQNKSEVIVVSGKAKGTDTLGENFAKESNYEVKEFPAKWNQYGKSAGFIRNAEMAEYADALIAFWDGKSKGTQNMIDEAENRGLLIRIYYY